MWFQNIGNMIDSSSVASMGDGQNTYRTQWTMSVAIKFYFENRIIIYNSLSCVYVDLPAQILRFVSNAIDHFCDVWTTLCFSRTDTQ